MTRPRIGILAVLVLIAMTSCERTPPPPPTSAPATQGSQETIDRLREQMEQEAGRTADAAKKLALSVAGQVRARYEERVQREVARVDEHIAELQKKLADASEAARPAIEEQLALWRQHAATIRDKLASLHGASNEAWDELKKELDVTVQQVLQALPGQPPTQPASAPTTRPGT
jgi:exonuclease VII large subunit